MYGCTVLQGCLAAVLASLVVAKAQRLLISGRTASLDGLASHDSLPLVLSWSATSVYVAFEASSSVTVSAPSLQPHNYCTPGAGLVSAL